MKTVAFVAPLLREATLRFVRAFADLHDIRLGIITQDDPAVLDRDIASRVEVIARVRDTLDGADLARGARELMGKMGRIDRLNGHLEQLQIPLAQARQALGIEGMWEEAALNFREKARMKDVLRRAGLPVARSRLLRSDRDLWAFVQDVGFPVVVKPPAGLGAKATFRIGDPAELAEALRQISPSPADPWQAEEFVTGRENTCETVTIRGRHVWRSGTRYLPGPLEVLENPWMQYCVLLPREEDDPDFTSFHPINGASLAALGMETGISHMEWFRRADGAAIVNEVGARPPGAGIMPLMSHANRADMWARWARLMTFDTFDPPTRQVAAGCAFLRGQGSGRVKAIHGLDRAQEEIGSLVVDRKLPEIGQPKNTSYEGEGWAIVAHPDTKTVAHALKRIIELIRIEYTG